MEKFGEAMTIFPFRPMRCRECRTWFNLGKRNFVSLCADCRRKKIDEAVHTTKLMQAFEESWERDKEGYLYLAGR